MGIKNDFKGLFFTEYFFIESDLVNRFALIGLVHFKPVDDFLHPASRKVFMRCDLSMIKIYVKVFGLVNVHDQNFPVELSFVYETKCTKYLDLDNIKQLSIFLTQVHNINRIIISLQF